MKKIERLEKICAFYVNDWHLTTMILPYMRTKIEEETKVITVLENGIQDNIKEILSKMNLRKELEEKILEINWTSSKIMKYSKMKEELVKQAKEGNNIEVLISGDKKYIELANKTIEKVIENTKAKGTIKIINCYQITNFNNISEITKKHHYVLNTSGIKRVEEVFKNHNSKEA